MELLDCPLGVGASGFRAMRHLMWNAGRRGSGAVCEWRFVEVEVAVEVMAVSWLSTSQKAAAAVRWEWDAISWMITGVVEPWVVPPR